MLCAANGVDEIYACEMFPTMAQAASRITQHNFPQGNIKVIPKRSTDLTVGNPTDDLPHKVDMIVSEIFDSVLLGEGVLPSLRHAIKHLMHEDHTPPYAIMPGKATMYARVVESESLFRLYSFSDTSVCENLRFGRSPDALKCSGGRVALPMHISKLKTPAKPLSEAFQVFQFDFSVPFPEHSVRKSVQSVRSTANGVAQCIILWWEVDFENDVVYSTYPEAENWQDHWVQAVFPLGKALPRQEGELIQITSFHNDLNVWFDAKVATDAVGKSDEIIDADMEAPEPCQCGQHVLCNSERIGMLTDPQRNLMYTKALEEICEAGKDLECLDISDGSLCALIAAAKGCQHVTSIESKSFSSLLSDQIANGNDLGDRIQVLECGCKGIELEHLHGQRKVDLLMAEPFYYAMQNLTIWQAVNFWYRRAALDSVLNENFTVLPFRGAVKVALVQFEHLYDCFGQVKCVQDFDHSHLDTLQVEWSDKNFPYPLWMYSHTLLSQPERLMTMEFSQLPESQFESVKVDVISSGSAHGVVMWVDYDLDAAGKYQISTDASSMHHKQLVRFFNKPIPVAESMQLEAMVNFNAGEGTIDFSFNIIN